LDSTEIPQSSKRIPNSPVSFITYSFMVMYVRRKADFMENSHRFFYRRGKFPRPLVTQGKLRGRPTSDPSPRVVVSYTGATRNAVYLPGARICAAPGRIHQNENSGVTGKSRHFRLVIDGARTLCVSCNGRDANCW
jgi:hypothetical protein